MTERDYQRVRAALRTEARPLILRLEAGGLTFRLHDGRVQVRPAGRLTDTDRAALRAHADAVRVLVQHRADWCAWPRPVPRFHPQRAFLTPDEIAGRTA